MDTLGSFCKRYTAMNTPMIDACANPASFFSYTCVRADQADQVRVPVQTSEGQDVAERNGSLQRDSTAPGPESEAVEKLLALLHLPPVFLPGHAAFAALRECSA